MKNKDGIVTVIAHAIGAGVGSVAIWCYWCFYIKPLYIHGEQLIADPLYIISAFFGVSLTIGGVLAVIPFIYFTLWWKLGKIAPLKDLVNPRLSLKVISILMVIGGGFAFVSNITLLHYVVPEYDYVLCPKKIGYKKNLLRDYVLDMSQCERF
ncbi:hypothetical protein LQM11_004434 [Vibrio parahaemolyticus]|nr:hypothetical protein [Vibrio parahaemolyticus]